MKNKFLKPFVFLGVLFTFVINFTSVKAADITSQASTSLVNIYVGNSTTPATGDVKIGVTDTVRVEYQADLTKVRPSNGDTITVTLPDPLIASTSVTNDIKDQNGNVIGTISVTQGSKTATVTFNDFYDKNPTVTISKPLTFDYRTSVDTTTVKYDTSYPTGLTDTAILVANPGTTPDSLLTKWGNSTVQVENGSLYTQWGVRVNRSGATIENAVLVDTLNPADSSSQEIDLSWGIRVLFQDANGTTVNDYRAGSEWFDSHVTYQKDDSGKVVGFTIDFGTLTSRVEVHYCTKVNDGGKSGTYANNAYLTGNNIDSQTRTVNSLYSDANGNIENSSSTSTSSSSSSSTEESSSSSSSSTEESSSSSSSSTDESSSSSSSSTEESSSSSSSSTEESSSSSSSSTGESSSSSSSSTEKTDTPAKTDPSKPSSTKPSNKKGLPTTGEQSNQYFVIIGLITLIAAMGISLTVIKHKN